MVKELLKTHLEPLLLAFRDKRVVKNICTLATRVVASGHINLYTMSENKLEYDRFRGLLNGEQVATLNSDVIIRCVQAKTLSDLGKGAKRLYILYDGCDIRKPNSKEMEYLGDVRSLSNTSIVGYKTMNSVVLDTDSQGVGLLTHELYSNKMPTYIGESVLNDPECKAALNTEQQKLVTAKTYINTKVLFHNSPQESSRLVKQTATESKICHVADREFDDEAHFWYITHELKDEFVIRCKANRLSDRTFPALTPTGKVSKKIGHYKLVDKKFAANSTYQISKITIKGVVHTNVTVKIDWESLKLGEKTYTIVRITLEKDGKPLYKQPMLLITNRVVMSAEAAKEIYMTYLLRSKIEVVFKFLKQRLGWEDFQIRDFNSIKNLLAFAFFLVGYYPDLKQELKTDPIAFLLCDLAKSKGKITLHFMLEGLKILAFWQKVDQWKTGFNISQEQIDDPLKRFKT